MEFLLTDFWNYLHFLLLIGIIILLLRDKRKVKNESKNQDDKTIWFKVKN